jgi:hypothetical protein
MFSPYYTPPATRLSQMEQQTYGMSFPQTIQTLSGVQPQVQCYFVNSATDLSNFQIQPSTVYIGINKASKEIYIRQWNMDGNIDFETYQLASGKQEQSDLQMIVSKLEAIEEKLKGAANEPVNTTVNAAGNVGHVAEQPYHGAVQSNDAWQRPPVPNTNIA